MGKVTAPDLGAECLGHIPAPRTQRHMSPHLQQGRFCQGWLMTDANVGTVAAAISPLCCQLVVAVFVCLLSLAGWERSTSQQRGSAAPLAPFMAFPPLSSLCRCAPEQ